MAPKKAPAKEDEKKAGEDTKKRKAEAEEAGPKKEAKKEEAAKKEPKKEEKKPKKEEEEADNAEKEKDAPKDSRPKIKEAITFYPVDTTLNVVPTLGGKVLMALSEGGMQYLIAGARANVGMKAGRYMYEVKIIEALNPAESSGGQRGRVPMPRQLVRLGFSTTKAPLILGEGNESAYFDSEGFYVSGKGKKTPASQRFTRDQVITVLLNLDPKSPNNNTLSLFREGERIAEPQPLPEHLHGKPLFPHVSFRSVTVQMLFGPQPARPLPFQCRSLQSAAQADVVMAPSPEPSEGKYEVMLPVAFPDEGTFDWLDNFLEKNPHYTELSDRRIMEWAACSGLWKPKGGGWQTSNDKPEFNFGLPGMDDMSIRRIIYNVAPVVPRNYVIMEVKSNLIAPDRKEVLAKFGAPFFKKVAHVIMGEPSDEYKAKHQERVLKEKQAKVDAEWKAKKAEEERKKQVELRQKQLQDMREKADLARKKAAEDAKRKREEAEAKKKAEEEKKKKAEEEAARKAEGGEEEGAKEETAEVKEEEAKEEEAASMEVDEKKDEAKLEPKDEPKEEEEENEEKPEEGPPQVELTEEEKKTWFRTPGPGGTSDLTNAVLSQNFGKFSIPTQDEGFDVIRFEWQDDAGSREYLTRWIKDRKLTSRIEELQPGQWFQDKLAEWLKTYQEWQTKHKEYNNSPSKKAKDEEKRRREEEKKEEGDDEEAKDPQMETDDLDIFSVEDVCDVGNGEPLFANFAFEDWALLQLRFDLYFLQLAYRKDVDDPERIGIHEPHLAFYYNKYYRKQLNPKYFGLSTNFELVKLVKDTVAITEDTQVLTSVLDGDTEEFDIFVKLTEENRRERQRRIDAGDETAKLKFSPMAIQQTQKPAIGAGMAGVRTGATWQQQARPAAQSWAQAVRPGTVYAQAGYRAPMAANRWPQTPTMAPRAGAAAVYGQKWR